MKLSQSYILGTVVAIFATMAPFFVSKAQEAPDYDEVTIAEGVSFAPAKISLEDLPTLTDAIRTKLGIQTEVARPCVIDFNATWCLPCLQFEPTFTKYKRTYLGRIDFAGCDYDRNRAIASTYRVQALPTILLFDASGRPVMQFVGPPDATTFDNALKELLAMSGIEELPAENVQFSSSDCEYFTLDGRQAGPSDRGLLIRREGTKSTLILRR